jgi:hypothetical protein
MFMPLLNNKLAVLDCKGLGLGQFAHLHPLRLAQADAGLDFEHRFSAAAPNMDMDMDRQMLIAVKKEPIPVLFEYFRHGARRALAEFSLKAVDTTYDRPKAATEHRCVVALRIENYTGIAANWRTNPTVRVSTNRRVL